MISVRTFTNQGSTWAAVAPTLEHVVRWANTQQKVLARPVATVGDPRRNSLIAELAFQAVARGYRRMRWENGGFAVEQVQRFIASLPGGWPAMGDVQWFEWREVEELTAPLTAYVDRLDTPVFSERVPGCGIVDAAVADITTALEIIEIKTVSRQFRSSDIRQALTYAAMFYAAGIPKDAITLLNPRLGTVVTIPLDLVAQVSGGDAAVDLLQDLVEAMSELQLSL